MSDSMFHLEVPFEGKIVPVTLRLAEWCQIAPVAQEALGARSALDQMLRTGVYSSIAAIDGKPLFGPRLDPFLADRHALAAVIERRYEIYERVRSAGRLLARCPRCEGGEVEVTLLGIFNTVGKLPPYIFSPDHLYFMPPIMGLDWERARRPARVEYARQLRFELPTKVLGLRSEAPGEGVVRAIEPTREADAWRRWETDGVNVAIGRSWWSRRTAAFRATVRLAVATQWSQGIESTPELFERLAAVDVYFLDALYWYTHHVDVPDHAPPRTCPICATRFLPVSPASMHIHLM